MERRDWKWQWCSLVVWLVIASHSFLLVDCSLKDHIRWKSTSSNRKILSTRPVKLSINKQHVVMDNGIVNVTLSNPGGKVTEIQYNGIKNILEPRNKEGQRGYWDIVWNRPGQNTSQFDTLDATRFSIIAQSDDKVEVSFTITWDPSRDPNGLPLNIDKRFIMLRGSSGFYSYGIFDHLKGWPAMNIDEARIAFKLQQNLFRYMAISDDIQTIMPSDSDRGLGQTLDYKEAVLLKHPSNPAFNGEVDDKYQYSCDNKDSRVHGWISSHPHTGFWVITPSDEFRVGGPVKQDLTSHAGPTSLAVFFSTHYAGIDMSVSIQDGEPWKKVFGPVFIYLNSDSHDNQPRTLWDNAKQQMLIETRSWPYDFPLSEDYPHADQRGTISGRMLIRDRYISKELMSAKSAYIGLAPMGEVGSWQMENKGYQFWNQADEKGYFRITGVRPGSYNLCAFVYGVLGDYKYDVKIDIKPGSEIKLGDIVYDPPRNGPTLWEIGIPDRTAAEFYVPDPARRLMNQLFINPKERFRQYGLWDRYTDLYPHGDLVYIVGKSNYSKDWFFAHVNRRAGNKTHLPTTWQIKFDLGNVVKTGTYKLRIALASATYAQLQIWINNPNTSGPHFGTRHIGRDNAIARHGIHGIYWLYSFDILGSQLVNGRNTIFLKQSNNGGPFMGLMYDYIRLEGTPVIV